ncbi:MAG TPA: alpha/beta hydrolase [Bacteroidales bacterium]|nr:alpha/beta hydrolase [Bacteroidales bacterium]
MRIIKRILYILAILIGLLALLMVTPRMIGLVFPEKMPIGYHFVWADMLAVGTGLEKIINRTPEIPAGIKEIRNIEYRNVNGKSLQLDMYIPEDVRKPAPLLVFIHGGGWKSGQRSDYLVYLVAFAKKGYITSTVSYRLLEDGTYPACAEDITEAFRWYFSNGEIYGYDPSRIAVIGGSAGGHLAMLAAYGWGQKADSSSGGNRIKAVVDIYGPVDLTTEYARNHPLVTGFIGKPYKEAPDLYREASPISYLDKSDPPTLILQGSSDKLVPASQSVMLKNKLDELGVPAILFKLPLWPHTMDIVQRVNDFTRLKMDDFFKEYLIGNI